MFNKLRTFLVYTYLLHRQSEYVVCLHNTITNIIDSSTLRIVHSWGEVIDFYTEVKSGNFYINNKIPKISGVHILRSEDLGVFFSIGFS